MATRLAAILVCVLGLALPAAAAARGPVPIAPAPQNLRGFLLRATERVSHVFPRTPSFAWTPVRGAKRYEFELATSKTFAENSVLWSDTTLTSPVASVPIALPWITGDKYSLYAHVRAVTSTGTTLWSAPFGFDVRWSQVPTPLPSSPGLLRWTPVPGATQYNVWLVDSGKVFTTVTNVADEREYYSFHQTPQWSGVVHWRVRPERYTYGTSANGLPATSFGPWSPVYTSFNPPLALGPLTPVSAVSNVMSDALGQNAHRLMPGFTFTGNTSIFGDSQSLYRVYISTDSDCINIVFRGAIVGSPAYAPRSTGPLALPGDLNSLAAASGVYLRDATGGGGEGATFMADGMSYPSTESSAGAGGSGGGSGSGGGGGTSAPPGQTIAGARVDLWDTDWPTGRYYWTVVPVKVVASSQGVQYRDTELPQEACQAGQVRTFGKTSEPAVTTGAQPFASGLSPAGRLVAATARAPRFYGTPLVAWQPALGADEYEVQYGRSPAFVGAKSVLTFGTSLTLPLSPGTWYYRVRGLDFSVPTKQQMAWSSPVKLLVSRPTFRILRRER
jgi:hypothetical protein